MTARLPETPEQLFAYHENNWFHPGNRTRDIGKLH